MTKRRKRVQWVSWEIVGEVQFQVTRGKSGNMPHGHDRIMRQARSRKRGREFHHEDCPCGIIEKDCGGHDEHS